MSDLLGLYSRMKQEFRQVVQFFGEDPARTRIDDFFSIFASFMTDFKARNHNKNTFVYPCVSATCSCVCGHVYLLCVHSCAYLFEWI